MSESLEKFQDLSVLDDLIREIQSIKYLTEEQISIALGKKNDGYLREAKSRAKGKGGKVSTTIINNVAALLSRLQKNNDSVAVKEVWKLNDAVSQVGSDVEEYRNRSNRFVKLDDGRYKMITKLVTKKARAGYLTGLGDEEYIETLPEQTWTLTEADLDSGLPKGTYRSFEITGDSMDNGSIESFPDRTVVLARLVPATNWQNNRLHIHKRRFFIIVSIEGQLCKEILDHNVDGGEILIHSLNPDKNSYPDEVVNLGHVIQIWNIVKKEMPV